MQARKQETRKRRHEQKIKEPLFTLTVNHDTWRRTIHQAISISTFEATRKTNIAEKRRRRMNRGAVAPNRDPTFICSHYNRACRSRISLTSHERACSRRGPHPS